MKEYRSIYFDRNPWLDDGLHGTSFLKVENEPALIVYTPDIECYCETEEQAKKIIDDWILENGSYEFYTAKRMRELF